MTSSDDLVDDANPAMSLWEAPSLHNASWESPLLDPTTTEISWAYNCTSTSCTTSPASGPSPQLTVTPSPTGPTLADMLAEVAWFRAALQLVTWLFPLVVAVGVVGNAVSLWVLLRRGMRRTSACRYLACLAVADTTVLLASALKTWVRVVWGFELLHVSPVACKLFIFLTHLSLTAAAWLIVAVTLERFLAVWLPLRATEVCSVGRTRVVIAAILTLLSLINAHVWWTAELVPVPSHRSLNSSGLQCASYAYRTLACEVFPWVHLMLYCFLPAALLLTLNVLILYKLFQHRQAITTEQESSRSSSNTRINVANGNNPCGGPAPHHYPSHNPHRLLTRVKSQTKLLLQQQSLFRRPSGQAPQHFHRRLAPMLLGVSFCWLVLATPLTIYSLAAPAPSDLEELGKQYLVKTICFLLLYLNHALNFFLYCLTGQRFRRELRCGLQCTTSERDMRLRQALLKKWVGNGQANKNSEQQEAVNLKGHSDSTDHYDQCMFTHHPLVEQNQTSNKESTESQESS